MKIQDWLNEQENILKSNPTRKKTTDVDLAVIKLYIAKHLHNDPAIMSYDFIGNTYGIWMSHKGSARASDAVREYPKAIRDHNLPKKIKAYELYNEKELPDYLLKKCKEYIKNVL